MASVSQPRPYRTTATAYARDTWNALQHHGPSTFEKTWAFLVAHTALVQGLYYVLTGLWPVLSISSFLAVTGHKTDVWLVQTLGLVLLVIGSTLCLAAYRRQKSPEVVLLALGTAVVLAGVEVFFVRGGQISAVYLLDAAAELGIVFLWYYAWYTEKRAKHHDLANFKETS